MSFPGFMDAKCLAASKPRPMLAPTTRIVWPVRSARRTGGTGVNWSLAAWKRENLMVGEVGGRESVSHRKYANLNCEALCGGVYKASQVET